MVPSTSWQVQARPRLSRWMSRPSPREVAFGLQVGGEPVPVVLIETLRERRLVAFGDRAQRGKQAFPVRGWFAWVGLVISRPCSSRPKTAMSTSC
jgi:hypothetical protein